MPGERDRPLGSAAGRLEARRRIEKDRGSRRQGRARELQGALRPHQGQARNQEVAAEQADFTSEREIVCRDYAREPAHGFCATRFTELRATGLVERSAAGRRRESLVRTEPAEAQAAGRRRDGGRAAAGGRRSRRRSADALDLAVQPVPLGRSDLIASAKPLQVPWFTHHLPPAGVRLAGGCARRPGPVTPASQPRIACLRGEAPVIAGERAGAAEHAVAGDDERDRVLAPRRRRRRARPSACRLAGDVRIGRGAAQRDRSSVSHTRTSKSEPISTTRRGVSPPVRGIEGAPRQAGRAVGVLDEVALAASAGACRRAQPRGPRRRRSRSRQGRAASPPRSPRRRARDGAIAQHRAPRPPAFHSPGSSPRGSRTGRAGGRARRGRPRRLVSSTLAEVAQQLAALSSVMACRNALGVSPAQRRNTWCRCDGESPTWAAISSSEGWSRQRVGDDRRARGARDHSRRRVRPARGGHRGGREFVHAACSMACLLFGRKIGTACPARHPKPAAWQARSGHRSGQAVQGL